MYVNHETLWNLFNSSYIMDLEYVKHLSYIFIINNPLLNYLKWVTRGNRVNSNSLKGVIFVTCSCIDNLQKYWLCSVFVLLFFTFFTFYFSLFFFLLHFLFFFIQFFFLSSYIHIYNVSFLGSCMCNVD